MESAWQQIQNTFVQEFSDVSDLQQATRITIRLTLAALLGGLLGFERETKGKAAGVRTHMLVAMGSALFVLISQQVGIVTTDLSRVIQGIVAGVGFLGAGAILKGRDDQHTKGLTTAAGIWMTSAIGVCAGIGYEATAVLSTVLALFIFTLVPPLVALADRDRRAKGMAKQTEDDANG